MLDVCYLQSVILMLSHKLEMENWCHLHAQICLLRVVWKCYIWFHCEWLDKCLLCDAKFIQQYSQNANMRFSINDHFCTKNLADTENTVTYLECKDQFRFLANGIFSLSHLVTYMRIFPSCDSDDHDWCKWENVFSGTDSPGLSQTKSREPKTVVCVCVSVS